MEHKRKSRNGQFAPEAQWPKRITKAYAFSLIHRARMRFYVGEMRDAYTSDIRQASGNALRACLLNTSTRKYGE